MLVKFNMLDDSEIFMRNVISIEDVGRDLKITYESKTLAPGELSDLYISKVGQRRKRHIINGVRSYEIQHGIEWDFTPGNSNIVLVDYHFYDLDPKCKYGKVYTRNGCKEYISPVYKAFKSGKTHMEVDQSDDKE